MEAEVKDPKDNATLEIFSPNREIEPGNRVRFNTSTALPADAWKKSWRTGEVVSWEEKRQGYMVLPDGKLRAVFVDGAPGSLRIYLEDFKLYAVVKKFNGQVRECLGAAKSEDEAVRQAIVAIWNTPAHIDFDNALTAELDAKYPKAHNYRFAKDERASEEAERRVEWISRWKDRMIEHGYVITQATLK